MNEYDKGLGILILGLAVAVIFAICALLFLAGCMKKTERIVERVPHCNIAQCYVTDETGRIHVQVFRDCVLDFKLVKDQQSGDMYWQVTLDDRGRSVRRVQAQYCEWAGDFAERK